MALLAFLPQIINGIGRRRIAKQMTHIMTNTFRSPMASIQGVRAKRTPTLRQFRTKTMPTIAVPIICLYQCQLRPSAFSTNHTHIMIAIHGIREGHVVDDVQATSEEAQTNGNHRPRASLEILLDGVKDVFVGIHIRSLESCQPLTRLLA